MFLAFKRKLANLNKAKNAQMINVCPRQFKPLPMTWQEHLALGCGIYIGAVALFHVIVLPLLILYFCFAVAGN
jgi:hypothetical protein